MFGDNPSKLVNIFLVEPSVMACETAAGEADGFNSRKSAATPATCGAAIDVPLRTAVAVLLVGQAE